MLGSDPFSGLKMRLLGGLGMRRRFAFVPFCVAVLFLLLGTLPTFTSAQTGDTGPTIQSLLKSGWQIAGFVSAGNNRNALVLFKHPTETYLVQCLTGYDVTRSPREFVSCYKLR